MAYPSELQVKLETGSYVPTDKVASTIERITKKINDVYKNTGRAGQEVITTRTTTYNYSVDLTTGIDVIASPGTTTTELTKINKILKEEIFTVQIPVPYTSELLLHFDSNFNDSSSSVKTVTNYGVTLDTGVKKFGAASAYFNGASYLTVAPATGLNFGTGDFTIEYFYKSAVNGFSMTSREENSDRFHFHSYGSDSQINAYNASWTEILTVPFLSYIDNNWHHVALVRDAGNFIVYHDGVTVGSRYSDLPVPDSGTWQIGRNAWDPVYYTGWIDEMRFVKGTAMYTADFTPPTAPFAS